MTVVYAFLLILTIIGTVAGVEGWRRRRETRALERALFAEIAPMRAQAAAMAAEIARRHQAGEPFDAAFFSLWRLSAPLIYPAAGASLGLLQGEGLDRVGFFHARLADARARLAEAQTAGRFEPSPYRMLYCLVAAINHVGRWTDAMEKRYGCIPCDMPDLAAANALVGTFERSGSEPIMIAYNWADCAVS
ncbi:hypothetical protein [Hyphococcus luteus]|uniref:Uncharacterized protein n=1 Tax=Hyphococcus luteus TaxID=2058213 RepID=A0A2S7K740_9PROT|nr:hypothetical protein [Marinicaulis flavus]PQA88281.1 hypothetical protein CW354_08255 [Marinicaulis flavus]